MTKELVEEPTYAVTRGKNARRRWFQAEVEAAKISAPQKMRQICDSYRTRNTTSQLFSAAQTQMSIAAVPVALDTRR